MRMWCLFRSLLAGRAFLVRLLRASASLLLEEVVLQMFGDRLRKGLGTAGSPVCFADLVGPDDGAIPNELHADRGRALDPGAIGEHAARELACARLCMPINRAGGQDELCF